MDLKEAREKKKLGQFIREKEKEYPKTNEAQFSVVVKSMASQVAKSKRGTSKKDSSAG